MVIKIHTFDLQFQDVSQAIASFGIEYRDGLVLIETGPESCRQNLLGALSASGFSKSDVKAIFVTHIHLDHAGGAGWWAAEQGVPIYAHPKGAKHLVNPTRLEESARMVYRDKFDSLWGALQPAPENKVNIINDNETIDFGDFEITAMATSGHAFHHHSYAIGKDLFPGDSLGARLPGSNYISVTSAPPQFNLRLTLESIEKQEAWAAENLYLTHFGQVMDAKSHCQDYRDAVELNAEFVRARLAEGMDDESLQVAYEAFNLEQAFRLEVPNSDWQKYQVVNGTSMCADGIRLYWEKLKE